MGTVQFREAMRENDFPIMAGEDKIVEVDENCIGI
jgi:hypothetical protein